MGKVLRAWAETAKPRKPKSAVPCDAERLYLFNGLHQTHDLRINQVLMSCVKPT
jgi:hypothetical protein